MTRRSFFSKLAAAAGIVALAPQLCFRPKAWFEQVWYPVLSSEQQRLFVETFFHGKRIPDYVIAESWKKMEPIVVP